MKQIRWGIIGCGNVTETKSGPAFKQITGSSIVAVMRRNAKKASDYANRHQITKSYSDAMDLINDTDVNAVYIATPPDSHAFYTLKALEAGKPVYVEKPMAINYTEALKMHEASLKHNIPVFVAYYRRALSGFLKIKELIENDSIGKISNINLKLHLPARKEDYNTDDLPWRVIPEKSGGGYFFDLASHQLDWLDYVFGKAEYITSEVKNRCGLYAAEDFVQAKLLYQNSINFTGSWNFCVSKENEIDLIEISGNKGKISFSTFEFKPIELENEKGKEIFSFEKPAHVQKQLIQQVVESLQGKDHCLNTAETALAASKIMEEIVYGHKI
ncbi:MAG: Gfo/Idh/MocA family oxidoreductase [Bacteroidales bacterium]|jgi:predicted dehydrogenase|nr:Gfo/Idh/MocA family oxidoreductase [Bacteroidales bacterium]